MRCNVGKYKFAIDNLKGAIIKQNTANQGLVEKCAQLIEENQALRDKLANISNSLDTMISIMMSINEGVSVKSNDSVKS